jgi:hypothetical protein
MVLTTQNHFRNQRFLLRPLLVLVRERQVVNHSYLRCLSFVYSFNHLIILATVTNIIRTSMMLLLVHPKNILSYSPLQMDTTEIYGKHKQAKKEAYREVALKQHSILLQQLKNVEVTFSVHFIP